MLTSRDKMFKDDDEPERTEREQDMEEFAVKMLDDLAMKIVDGDIIVKNLSIYPNDLEINNSDRLEPIGPTTFEIEYNAPK